MSKSRIAEFALLVTAVIWGFAFVAQRTAMQHLGPFGFNAVRFLLAGIVVGGVLLISGRIKRITRQEIFLGSVLGVVLFSGAAFQQIGVVTTSAGKAGFITGLYVAIIPLILWVFQRRPTRAITCTGIFLALIGLYLLSATSQFTVEIGDVWVLFCAFVFALHVVLSERWVSTQDPLTLSMAQFFVAAIISLVVALGFESISYAQIESAWMEVLYAGCISAAIGYTIQLVAQRHTSSVTAGVILSLESVFAAIAGWFILREVFTGRQLLGCVLILVGTLLAQMPSKARRE